MQDRLRDGGVDIGDCESQVVPIMIRNDATIFDIGEPYATKGVAVGVVAFGHVEELVGRAALALGAVAVDPTPTSPGCRARP